MSDTNRVRVAYVAEASFGVTPTISATVPMRTARITGESLSFNINNVISNELRADRNFSDLVQVGAQNGGDLNFELSYPDTRSFHGEFMAAALYSSWLETPEFANWATADSNVTDAGTVANTYAVAAGGTAVIAGHMVRATGFTNAANNQVFKVASSTATTIVGTALGLVAEAVPPLGSRLKVVGWQGATADLSLSTTAPLGGGVVKLVSATQDWTLVTGLRVGSVVKLSGFTDNSGANNYWARVIGIGGASNRELYLTDISGASAVAEVATSRTVTVWFGDVLRNGTTRTSFTIEKAFLDQSPINYAVYKGMVPGQMSINYQAGSIVTGSFSFIGTTHSVGASQLGAPVAATTYDVLNAVSNVGRISENGTTISAANFIQQLQVSFNNNLREQMAIGTLGLIGVGAGRFEATGTLKAYFDNTTYYSRYLAGTRTSLMVRQSDSAGRVTCMTHPVVEYTSGKIVADGPNNDVFCELGFTAVLDTITNCAVQFDRIEYSV